MRIIIPQPLSPITERTELSDSSFNTLELSHIPIQFESAEHSNDSSEYFETSSKKHNHDASVGKENGLNESDRTLNSNHN